MPETKNGVKGKKALDAIFLLESALKVGALKVGALKLGALKLGPIKVGVTKVGATKVGVTKVGAAKVGAKWERVAEALRCDSRIGPHAYLTPGRWQDSRHLLRDHVTLEELLAR